MQKKTKLKLSKITIRNLSNPELENAAGGHTGRICAEIFCIKSGSCTAAAPCFTQGCKGR